MPVGKTSTPFFKKHIHLVPKKKKLRTWTLDNVLEWKGQYLSSVCIFSISDYVLLSHSHSAQLCSSFQHGLQKCDLRGHGIKKLDLHQSFLRTFKKIEGQMLSNPIYPQYFFYSFFLWFIEYDDGKIYRKTLYLMVKTMVSCRFSLQPTQWLMFFFF